jgi:hypothetical protein
MFSSVGTKKIKKTDKKENEHPMTPVLLTQLAMITPLAAGLAPSTPVETSKESGTRVRLSSLFGASVAWMVGVRLAFLLPLQHRPRCQTSSQTSPR